jgi:hypothetical protein
VLFALFAISALAEASWESMALKPIALLQLEFRAAPRFETGGNREVQRVSDAINHIDQETDVRRFIDGLSTDACCLQRGDIVRANRLGMEGRLFQVAQDRPQFLIDRSALPVIQDCLGERIAQDLRRDRAVIACSELALILARHERGKEFAFPHAPAGRTTYHGLEQGEVVLAEEFRPIEHHFDHIVGLVRIAAEETDQAHGQLLRQALTRFDVMQSHLFLPLLARPARL